MVVTTTLASGFLTSKYRYVSQPRTSRDRDRIGTPIKGDARLHTWRASDPVQRDYDELPGVALDREGNRVAPPPASVAQGSLPGAPELIGSNGALNLGQRLRILSAGRGKAT